MILPNNVIKEFKFTCGMLRDESYNQALKEANESIDNVINERLWDFGFPNLNDNEEFAIAVKTFKQRIEGLKKKWLVKRQELDITKQEKFN